ncbi:type III-A CRISPR-associated protein Cas10/Csm1 [Trichormus sp. NMC-1]|uniref:type III-A CRISPR-associated protein Cas10/Csm1 n=1 Tax=Trichormus sp. NMC-1 TaxID=1853259 RepID=UPI0008DBFF8F|nr:type III-A CRISPR-associated protein Cas10/Csm1 [Trichormus sp. NMC-1]
MTSSEKVALQVVQQAIAVLAKWAKSDVVSKLFQSSPNIIDSAVEEAQKILSWPSDGEPQALRLLFDYVNLEKGQLKEHYWQPQAIDNSDPKIPYPVTEIPGLNNFRQELKIALDSLEQEDCENLSLLTLFLEKFGSFISFGSENIALIDLVKSTAAVASVLVNNSESENVTLIAGDLSGIQKFIYTISSDGALKSLRARSFYLELVTEEVVQQLLDKLELPRTNVIYAGGGNFYLIASDNTEQVNKVINKIRQDFNNWLRRTFKGQLFLAIDSLTVPNQSLNNQSFACYWTKVTKKLAKQKSCKFSHEINDFLKVTRSHTPCTICHRDDLQSLKPLIRLNQDSSSACWMCRTMFELGDNLLDVKAVLRSKRSKIQKFRIKGSVDRIYLANNYYYFFSKLEDAVNLSQDNEIILLINNWEIKNYKLSYIVPLLLGNYGKRSEEKLEYQKDFGFMRAEEMAKKAQGIERVASLRMDVDKLGQIFAKGLGENQTLTRLAGLSRQMSYFFKVYLNSLAEKRNVNIPPENFKQLLPKDEPYNILFIYAGGDDLFISGAWNEAVNFGFDVYQCFRAYTGYNPDITLSGGISIDTPKFPLYQAAKSSGHAEDAAKANGRDSLGLFGQVFKWDEWLGIEDINDDHLDSDIKKYLSSENKPKFLGILPFVEILEQQNIGVNYSHNFVRNLLITAQIQEQALEKFNDKKTQEALGNRYYLHLPKIAYTLSRLSREVLKNDDFRTSLKSPYNAPYFRAIATWIELLNRTQNNDTTT